MNATDIIRSIEQEQLKAEVDEFRVGDTVKVYVRRAKLNYLRGRVGKRAKVKELMK